MRRGPLTPRAAPLLRACLESAPAGASPRATALPRPCRYSQLTAHNSQDRVWRLSKHALRIAVWTLFLVVLLAPLAAADTLDLAGSWKFSTDPNEGGRNAHWEKPDFNDASWKDLTVPGAWEEQGIMKPNPRWPSTAENDGYNGYAWYRKHVQIPAAWKEGTSTLHFGGIDDLDWVYVNGLPVGSTTKPGQDKVERNYTIPAGTLKPGADNVIAVQVLDTGGLGGIVQGPVELEFTPPVPPAPSTPPAPPGTYAQIHDGDLSRMGGSVDVPADMEVRGNVVVMGGSASISGHVTGNVSAIGGSVELHQGARVDGDATSLGGRIVRAEGATIGGKTVETSGVPDWFVRRAFRGPGWHPEGMAYNSAAEFFYVLLRWAFLALLAALLLPRRMEVMARALPLLPGRAALYGTVGIILTPAALVAAVLLGAVVIVVLAITIVGILAIPAVPAAWAGIGIAVVVFFVLGSTGVMLSLGQAILGRLRPEPPNVVAAAVVGAVVVSALCTIPVIGILVLLTVVIFGYGLALMTGLGSHEEWASRHVFSRREGEAAPPPPPAPVPPAQPTRVVARARTTEEEAVPPLPEPPVAPEGLETGEPPAPGETGTPEEQAPPPA